MRNALTKFFIIDNNNTITNIKITEKPMHFLYFLSSPIPAINGVVIAINKPTGIPNDVIW